MSIFSSIRNGVWGHSNPTKNGGDYSLEEDNLYFIDTAFSGAGYIRLGIFRDPLNLVGKFQVPQAEMVLDEAGVLELIKTLERALEIEWPK